VTLYVDPLQRHHWILRGRPIPNCHLFTDGELEDLHRFAELIGMKRAWFQDHWRIPHYDLTPARRDRAIAAGAVALTRREAVEIWHRIRDAQAIEVRSLDAAEIFARVLEGPREPRRSVIVCGPKGSGKTEHRWRLADYFGLMRVFDNWRPETPPPEHDTLILTRAPRGTFPDRAMRVITMHEAIALCGPKHYSQPGEDPN
jgi:hypothetical protein